MQTMPERGPECRPSAGHSVPQCRPSAGTPCPSAGKCRPNIRPGTPCLSAGLRPALHAPVQASAGLRAALRAPSAPSAPNAGQCRPSAGHSVAPVPAFGPSAGTPCPQCIPAPALLPCPHCPESPSARAGQCRTAAACLAAFTRRYKLAAPRKAFYLVPFLVFFQYNKRLLRQKMGGACLYMPQDGHWLASFEVIPPPPKS